MATAPAPNTIVIPPEEIIAATFGPFVTGIMLQMMLMGVIVVQVYDYYRVFGNDPPSYKIVVGMLFGVTILQATMDYTQLYRCAVIFYGNFDKFDDTDWTLWWEIAVTAIIGSICQAFFLERCWNATKSMIAVGVGAIGILLSLASGIASTIEFQHIRRLSLVPGIPGPILTWLISTAVVDLGIAIVLMWSLTSRKTKFRKTETIVSRIVRLTFTTSSLTATIAVVNVVLYLGLPGKAYHLLPQLSMGKLYVISTMVTLSSRQELREIMQTNDHASYADSGSNNKLGGATTNRGRRTSLSHTKVVNGGLTSNNGIQVRTHTVTYTHDDHDGEAALAVDDKRGQDFVDLEEQSQSDMELDRMDRVPKSNVQLPQETRGTDASMDQSVRGKAPTFTRLGGVLH
ncbi:hypothetical protein FRB95_000670 [Tulasnella sp. JGI-2019a]|nr:hypothetical protein FRB95_000670 [Tulasnella sp. JGI-2019a]